MNQGARGDVQARRYTYATSAVVTPEPHHRVVAIPIVSPATVYRRKESSAAAADVLLEHA
jgi:hypothetical protein